MSLTLKDQKFGSQLQTKLPTRSEARFFRGILRCGGCFLAALAVVVIQQVYIARTFAAHLKAGGIDDPDVVFGHFNPLFFLAPVAVAIFALGLFVCIMGWLFRRFQRHRRMRKQLRQWQNPHTEQGSFRNEPT